MPVPASQLQCLLLWTLVATAGASGTPSVKAQAQTALKDTTRAAVDTIAASQRLASDAFAESRRIAADTMQAVVSNVQNLWSDGTCAPHDLLRASGLPEPLCAVEEQIVDAPGAKWLGPLQDLRDADGRRPRVAVRLARWLASNWRSAFVLRFVVLVVLVRICAVPWARWQQIGGGVGSAVRKMFYGGILFLVFGPTCGAILVWALVLLPLVMMIVFIVVVSLRAAAHVP